MRILVTGARGQLGRELVETLGDHDVTGLARDRLDVADRDAVLEALVSLRPDVVVHTASWTDVDGCEGDPDRAWLVNALGTRHVAHGARLAGATLCYISTDYVFAGDADRPYTEWDEPDPKSVYGRSKLGGERELGAGDMIVRTSWLCGRYGRNFVKTMLRLAGEREDITVVDDQHGCPTFADDLAAMIASMVSSRFTGMFHVTNQGPTTWFDLARATLVAGGFDPARVRPISSADLDPPRPAPRPAWSVLDNTALRLSGVPLLPDHRESLERLVKQVQQ
ncbi:MAG: dTDP-4-dehydrorhamnose reductase [Actinomycetota bacterium]|nr:dTDP-4-dehydrorhamnose reductase [Actinomycetota bacterium]MDQ3640459.1 dTDP-4-dehydrorhamnose reductase [Actinomycetota bacterium]